MAKPCLPGGPASLNLALLKFVPQTADCWDAPNSKMVRTFAVMTSTAAGKPIGMDERCSVNRGS